MSAAAIAISWRWPFVGDESILHYVVFLLGKGFRPYVDIKDLNLPGSYLLDWLVMHALGAGARGEHLYDLLLCLLAAAAAVWSAWPDKRRAIATLSATLLFVLFHLQDGIVEIGQRDFAMAVFVLCAYAVLVRESGTPPQRIFVFYLLLGSIATIKPTLLALAVLPFIVPSLRSWFRDAKLSATLLALAGFAIAPALAAGWLCSHSAFGAFVECLRSLGAMHASVARRGPWMIFLHALSPGRELFLIAFALILLARLPWTTERRLLALCAAAGLLSCLIQGKGLSYHRYTFLLFALLLLFHDFDQMARLPGWRRNLALSCIAAFTLFLAPFSVWRIAHFDTATPFDDALTQQLTQTGALSQRGIQCLDTFAGCNNTLYNLRLVQSTGYLYDCYLAIPRSPQRDRYRDEFVQALESSSPHAIVLTDRPCFTEHQGYEWIADWTAFASYLDDNYRLASDWRSTQLIRWWSHAETPAAFRIYIRR
ncbi:MAG TPA: hypothetical protein VIM60_04260 [Edaphobacter sp.]